MTKKVSKILRWLRDEETDLTWPEKRDFSSLLLVVRNTLAERGLNGIAVEQLRSMEFVAVFGKIGQHPITRMSSHPGMLNDILDVLIYLGQAELRDGRVYHVLCVRH